MTNALGIIGRYPPTIQQRAIIAMLTGNSRSEISYMLKLAFLVKPRADLRRLDRTFAKLAARHDALRQSFERQGDTWFVNVWNRHRTGLLVEDHGDISDADFGALLDHHSSVQIKLLDDVLYQAVVLRCGARGDVLFVRCHHAIVDAHSMIILVEDWLNLLIGIPLFGSGVTHEEYLSEHSSLSPRQQLDNDQYWNQLLFPALPNPGLGKFGSSGDRPRIVLQRDTIRSTTCSLARSEYDELPKAVNARSQTPFSIVMAAFADTTIELSELPGIYVHTTVDRTSKRLANFVGCAIRWLPVRCEPAFGASLPEYSSNLAVQLKQSLVHLPSEVQGYELEFDQAVHKAGGLLRHFNCSVTFTDARAKKSSFSSGFKAAVGAPRKLGPLTLARLEIATKGYNFNGLRLGIAPHADRTEFVFGYHSHFFTETDISTLLLGMQDKLRIRLV